MAKVTEPANVPTTRTFIKSIIAFRLHGLTFKAVPLCLPTLFDILLDLQMKNVIKLILWYERNR